MTIDWEKRQSEVISAMRFPLIVLVVFIHVLPGYIPNIDCSHISNFFYSIISEFISHNVGRICVPIFFIISGYFFFSNIDSFNYQTYVKKLKRRSRTLLIPYILWNVITLAAGTSLYILFRKLSIPNDIGDPLPISLYNTFWGMPQDFPLWYIRDLMCMTILTPLFYYYFKYLKKYGAILLWLLYVVCIESEVPGLSTTSILYFGIGSYFGINKVNMLELFNKIKAPAYIISAIFLIFAILYNGKTPQEYLIRCYIPLGIVSAFNMTDEIIERHKKTKIILTSLSPSTFFIYATHEIFIINWTKGFFSRLPLADSDWGLLLSYFLIPTITVCICLAAYYLLSKMLPGFMRAATGGRAKPKTEAVVK